MNSGSGNAAPRPVTLAAVTAGAVALCQAIVLAGVAESADPDHAFGPPGRAGTFAGTPRQHPVGRPLGDVIMASLDRRGALHSVVVDGRPRWWLDTEAQPNGRLDSSDLTFETRMDRGRLRPFVTCATCHEHAEDLKRISLRLPNRGGGLCRACHER